MVSRFSPEEVNDSKATEIVNKLEKEKERHDQAVEEEEERHKQNKEKLKEQSRLSELGRLYDRVSNMGDKLGRQKNRIQELFYKGIWASMPRKKTYIDDTLTIREQNVFRHGYGDDARLEKVDEYKMEILREVDDNRQETVNDAFKQIDRMNSFKGSNRFFSTVETDEKFENLDLVIYSAVMGSSFGIADSEKFEDKEKIRRRDIDEEVYFSYRGGPKKKDVALSIAYLDEGKQVLEETIEALEEEIEAREEIAENLESLFKKQFMVKDI